MQQRELFTGVLMKFYLPTKILKGRGCVLENKEQLVLGKRAFVVTGRSSGRLSGALKDVEDLLKECNVPYAVWDRIGNNPTVEECFEAGNAAREFNADFIVGIGGGSPLDASKAIAVYAVNPQMLPMDIYKGNYEHRPLPMSAIPTTAGTGSEVTQYSVLTVTSECTKRSFSTEDTFFKTAFLDGKYTEALPLQITRNTAVDALSHLIESFTNTRATEMTEYIALEGMKIWGKKISALKDGSFTSKDREDLLWASALGGIVIAQTGTTIVHSMGYPLTFYKDIPHGMANGLLLEQYLANAQKVLPQKVKLILDAMEVPDVKTLGEILRSLLPNSYTFTKAETDQWVQTTVKAKNAATCPFEASVETETDIFEKSLL